LLQLSPSNLKSFKLPMTCSQYQLSVRTSSMASLLERFYKQACRWQLTLASDELAGDRALKHDSSEQNTISNTFKLKFVPFHSLQFSISHPIRKDERDFTLIGERAGLQVR
jgi:hypothetical protein